MKLKVPQHLFLYMAGVAGVVLLLLGHQMHLSPAGHKLLMIWILFVVFGLMGAWSAGTAEQPAEPRKERRPIRVAVRVPRFYAHRAKIAVKKFLF